ncbi:MAG: type II secretion system F family protein [Proteobacteria bacterium]|nr:type II secretion system F family protein [Pseudomonadota bacterium]
MPTYLYRAKITSTGAVRRGEMDATSPEACTQRLQANGLEVYSVKQKPDGIPPFKVPGTSGVKSRELVIFSRQLSTMIDAGLPIVQALDLLSSQEQNYHFKKVQLAIKADVETGMTFGDALRKHPKVFSALYCSLVTAGEIGGVLDTILTRLCTQLEKADAMKRKIKGALTYPLGTLAVSLLIAIFMLWKVIPTFQDMFSAMGNELPGLTQGLVDLSHWVTDNILLIFLTLVAVPTAIAFALKQRPIKKAVDTILLDVPGVGNVIRKSAVSTFTRTLGTMLSSGVPLMDALTIVSDSLTNIAISEAVLFARARLSEGSTLADPLLVTGIFPNMVVQMIRVGEETGALDTMLNKIADFYDEEVDEAIAGLMAMLEPLVMCVLAGVVGSMLIGMYLPIFSMSSGVNG